MGDADANLLYGTLLIDSNSETLRKEIPAIEFCRQFERSVGRFECFDAVEAVDANTLCPDDVCHHTSVGGIP